MRHRAVSLFRVCDGPFAADHRSGCKLGRRSQRPVGCHARMVQLPSDAPLPRLGQASFAVALVGSPVASRIASQAHPVERDGCLTSQNSSVLILWLRSKSGNGGCSSPVSPLGLQADEPSRQAPATHPGEACAPFLLCIPHPTPNKVRLFISWMNHRGFRARFL